LGFIAPLRVAAPFLANGMLGGTYVPRVRAPHVMGTRHLGGTGSLAPKLGALLCLWLCPQ